MASAKLSPSQKRGDSQRFTDVSEESNNMLSPLPPIIHQHSRTSSLQEAIQPICLLVEDLPNRVAISLERSQNPKDGLTRDESAAIYLYTQQWPPGKISFYTMFNRALRDENRTKIAPFSQYLNLFMSAFKKLPSIEDRVWRGETRDYGNQYKRDTIHVWWGVSSCTDMIHVTSGFLDESQKRTLFNIKCVNGKVIKNHSAYPDESETILPPGTYLKVKSLLNGAPSLCIVELEEVKPNSSEFEQSATNADSAVPLDISLSGKIYVLWFDSDVNRTQENMKIQEMLKKLFGNSFKWFEQLEETVNYIRGKKNHSFILISGGRIGRQIVPQVNESSQLHGIVIYCMDKQANEKWSKDYKKVKAVVVTEDEMIKAVQELHKELVKQQKSSTNNKPKPISLESDESSNDQPQEMFSPLHGLMDSPLRRFEQTLQGFDDIIPDVESYVYMAKKNSKNPADGLTPDESAAIMIYTKEWESSESSLYLLLNSTLRSKSRDALVRWFPYLRLLLHALRKLPSTKQTVWRGIREDLSDRFIIGETVIWWSISSATTGLSILENPAYVGQHGTRTIFSIECQNGKSIQKYSYFSNEDEILLLPGSQFIVTNVLNCGNGLHIINLKEVGDPYSLY